MKISDGNILYDAYLRSIKGSKKKAAVIRFRQHVLENLSDIQKELESHTYKTKQRSEFTISERGKTRSIHGNTVSDRIVRHALCDNELMPAVEPYLSYDNGASRKGKGVKHARDRLKVHLERYVAEHGPTGYILLYDFSKYYDNIRHDIAIRELEKHVTDPDVREVLEEIIDSMKVDVSYMTDEEYDACMETKFNSLDYLNVPKEMRTGKRFMKKSMSIGDQVSQVVSIYLPTPIDNYIRIVKGIGNSARYMDDGYAIHESKEYLREVLAGMREICGELGIFINENKTQICRIDRPFHYLQDVYHVTKSGKVAVRINKKKVTRMRRRIKGQYALAATGEMDIRDLENCYKSWMGSFKPTMSDIQIENMEILHSQLAREYKEAMEKGDQHGRETHDRACGRDKVGKP